LILNAGARKTDGSLAEREGFEPPRDCRRLQHLRGLES
jgi:hypothetical protein